MKIKCKFNSLFKIINNYQKQAFGMQLFINHCVQVVMMESDGKQIGNSDLHGNV